MSNVLGPEWGALAGLEATTALEMITRRSYEQEQELEQLRPADPPASGGEPPVPARQTDIMEVVRTMNAATKAPLQAEFVGQRNVAKAQARAKIIEHGENWDAIDVDIESAMVQATPEQLVDAASWYNAFWLVWGVKQRDERLASINTPAEPNALPHSQSTQQVTRVSAGSMNSHHGQRTPTDTRTPKYSVDNPEERQVRGQFERLIGERIDDEEWVRLSSNEIRTQDDWNRLQKELGNGE